MSNGYVKSSRTYGKTPPPTEAANWGGRIRRVVDRRFLGSGLLQKEDAGGPHFPGQDLMEDEEEPVEPWPPEKIGRFPAIGDSRDTAAIEMPFDIGARIEPISGGKRINSLSMRLNEAQHGVMPLIGNEGRGKLQIAEPIRRPHRNPAARPQDALQLPRDGAGIVDMFENIVGDDEIEGIRLKRQLPGRV